MSDLFARAALLETLRLSRGLTQNELAAVSGISQASLSKAENAVFDLDDDRWAILADVLHVPVEAFLNAARPVHPARIFHRKKKGTPKGALVKIGADAALTQTRVNALLDARATIGLKTYDLDDGFVTPQEVAQYIRRDLGLSDEPIDDLIAVAEGAGVIVVRWPLESIQVDAIATWPVEGRPVILVGEHVPAERQRFTMAHEIGHAVMHHEDQGDDMERQADAFASELLLPAARLRKEWPRGATVETLIPVKHRWGISLSALIRRANDIGLISERDYRDWNIRLSTTGMNRREPEPLDREDPHLLRDTVSAAQAAGNTIDDLAARTNMLPREFTDTFLEGTA